MRFDDGLQGGQACCAVCAGQFQQRSGFVGAVAGVAAQRLLEAVGALGERGGVGGENHGMREHAVAVGRAGVALPMLGGAGDFAAGGGQIVAAVAK